MWNLFYILLVNKVNDYYYYHCIIFFTYDYIYFLLYVKLILWFIYDYAHCFGFILFYVKYFGFTWKWKGDGGSEQFYFSVIEIIIFLVWIRLGNGPQRDHRTGTNRYWTGTNRYRTEMGWVDLFVDRYSDEPDGNYRDGYSIWFRPVPSHCIPGWNRNGLEWNGMG